MTEEIQEAAAEAIPTPPLPGKILAQIREEKGISVADVARSLRLSVKQIEAIEADNFDKLPGKTFLRGFIRNYAKLLQIDPEPLLQGNLAAEPHQRFQVQAISVPPGQVEFNTPRGQRTFSTDPGRPWLKYALAALVVVVLAGGAAYELLRGSEIHTVVVKPVGDNSPVPLVLPAPADAQTDTQTPALPQAAAPAPNAEAAPLTVQQPASVEAATAPPGSAKVKFSFSGESWVELKDRNGRTIYKQTGYAGTEQTISGTSPFSLTVGRAANVKVLHNDKPVDLTPYASGDVARLNLE